MLQVLGVQVGAVQPLQVGEQCVMSGFRKQAARGPVAVGALGLSIDVDAFFVDAGQLQLKHHGGAWCGG